MKKFIIYLLIVLVFVAGKTYDTNTRNKARNEALKEIEQEKEQQENQMYWDEFNEQYIIEIDGDLYTFNENQIKYINEWDDLEGLKPIFKKVIEEGGKNENWYY